MSKGGQLQTSPAQAQAQAQARDGKSGLAVRCPVFPLDMLLCLLEPQNVNQVGRRVFVRIGVSRNGVAE